MIRGILAILFVVVFLIVSIPIFLILWIVGKVNRRRADMMGLAIVSWAFRVVQFICGVHLVVQGLDNVPRDQAVVYIGNHRSFFDVICSYPLCPGLTGYIAKDQFEHVPLLSTWMRRLYCQFLDRSNTRAGVQMVLNAIKLVKSGISIFIYPEGTRSKTEAMLPFRDGSFKIATKSGAKIIPVAVTNSSSLLEDRFPHMPWIQKGTIVMTYGKPIETKGMSREDQKTLGDRVHRQIAQMLLANEGVWMANASKKELARINAGIRSVSNPGCVPEDAQ